MKAFFLATLLAAVVLLKAASCSSLVYQGKYKSISISIMVLFWPLKNHQ
jgi:hypothetical protein